MPVMPSGHFDLANHQAYVRWRNRRCAAYPVSLSELSVDIQSANKLSKQEASQLQRHINQYNMAVYRSPDLSENSQIPLNIGHQFGLHRLDSNLGAGSDAITEIMVRKKGIHGRYIPYTTRNLSWHADGYYNAPQQQIRAMSLHCVRPAMSGGQNQLLDPEMAYIYLRDLDPRYIQALLATDVMTIPANEADGKLLRPAQSGPVFSFDARGDLHMRYSARKRNIEWKSLPEVQEAVAALKALCERRSKWIIQGSLAAGEGLICNNVLHNRTEFEEDPQAPRLLYRLRYYDRILTT